MFRPTSYLLALTLTLTFACKKDDSSTPPDTTDQGTDEKHPAAEDLEGRPVVDNWKAQVGDVTVCPISGKKFEVKQDSGHYEYQGYTFVFCCAGGCLDKVKAEPGKYLDKLVEQAGGPASDPDKLPGGAIDDT
jgi:YHS domain-containing protein